MARRWKAVPVVPVVALLVVGTFILVVGIILIPVFTAILHDEFKTLIPLTNKSTTLGTWEDPRDSVDMHMKFYFFDLQNPAEVSKGEKPYLVQKGPYTYEEVKIKKDVKFDTADSTVSFRSPRSMIFNRSLSAGSENDTFTTINVPLVAVVTMVKSIPAFEELLSLAISSGLIKNEPTFKRLSVYQLLWGYEDTLMVDVAELLKIANMSLPLPVDGYFGFFYKKNGTDDGLYRVKTGQDDLNKFMEVTEWNNNQSVPYWKTPYCNMINGTDGTMYHPFIDTKEKLYIFSSDLCRSIDVVYDSSHYLQDIPQYRFKPPESLFGYPPENYDSACYCVGPDGCPHAGVLNISACQQGAPVFVSQPHFLNGDYYLNTVRGLSPNETMHNTFIDVEPTTGIVMHGAKRLQMNLAVDKNPYVSEMANLPSLLFPLLWLEEGALINAKGISTFKDEFFNLQQAVAVASYILIVIGALIIILTLVYVIVKSRNYTKMQKVLVTERTPILSGGKQPNYQNMPPPPISSDENDWGKMMGEDLH